MTVGEGRGAHLFRTLVAERLTPWRGPNLAALTGALAGLTADMLSEAFRLGIRIVLPTPEITASALPYTARMMGMPFLTRATYTQNRNALLAWLDDPLGGPSQGMPRAGSFAWFAFWAGDDPNRVGSLTNPAISFNDSSTTAPRQYGTGLQYGTGATYDRQVPDPARLELLRALTRYFPARCQIGPLL